MRIVSDCAKSIALSRGIKKNIRREYGSSSTVIKFRHWDWITQWFGSARLCERPRNCRRCCMKEWRYTCGIAFVFCITLYSGHIRRYGILGLEIRWLLIVFKLPDGNCIVNLLSVDKSLKYCHNLSVVSYYVLSSFEVEFIDNDNYYYYWYVHLLRMAAQNGIIYW